MALNIGIVGLPNVGKSTIFNALTKNNAAEAANYPFCTIDPNVGIVEVPDIRLDKLSEISASKKIVPAAIQFVDIAGLVKGASEGEGLGNKFLSHIRECDAIGHVIRIFDNPNITHVHGEINPKQDREVIEAELLLADLQTVEKRLTKATSDAKSGNKDKKAYLEIIQKLHSELTSGKLASDIDFSEDELIAIRDLHLLSIKPNIYIINVPEDEISNVDISKISEQLGVKDLDKIIPICAKVEEDLIAFSDDEKKEYLEDLNIKSSGLDALIRSAYKLLGLQTYFTSGEKETRAWTIKIGTNAKKAAGVIHTDFEDGFIKAEVLSYDDIVKAGSFALAKEKGLMRLEGKEYIVQDGDIMIFRFSK